MSQIPISNDLLEKYRNGELSEQENQQIKKYLLTKRLLQYKRAQLFKDMLQEKWAAEIAPLAKTDSETPISESPKDEALTPVFEKLTLEPISAELAVKPNFFKQVTMFFRSHFAAAACIASLFAYPFRIPIKNFLVPSSTAQNSIESAYPGGKEALMKYLKENLQYPNLSLKDQTQNTVIVEFTVKPDGSIYEIKVLKSIGTGYDDEAIRLIQFMPHWLPSSIPHKYKLPISFNQKN